MEIFGCLLIVVLDPFIQFLFYFSLLLILVEHEGMLANPLHMIGMAYKYKSATK